MDDGHNHFVGNSLPKTPLNWVTLKHDVDYANATNTSIDKVWELDKEAILEAQKIQDPWWGVQATTAGLLLKNVAERTVESVTGDDRVLYPKPKSAEVEHIDWFDRVLSRRRPPLPTGTIHFNNI